MTIDFLRARLLSERSVSRAAKERADQLARRVSDNARASTALIPSAHILAYPLGSLRSLPAGRGPGGAAPGGDGAAPQGGAGGRRGARHPRLAGLRPPLRRNRRIRLRRRGRRRRTRCRQNSPRQCPRGCAGGRAVGLAAGRPRGCFSGRGTVLEGPRGGPRMGEAAAAAAAERQAARAEAGSWPQEGPLLHARHGFLAQVPSGAVVPEDQEEGAEVRASHITRILRQLMICSFYVLPDMMPSNECFN
jgi:hypothetical protein